MFGLIDLFDVFGIRMAFEDCLNSVLIGDDINYYEGCDGTA